MLKAIRVNALVLVAAFAPFACAQDSGEELYKANCSTCHGLTGEADTPAGQALKARSLKSLKFWRSPTPNCSHCEKGQGTNAAWGDVLTDSQLKNVIAYIHTLQKSKIEAGSSAIDPAAAGSGKQ